MPDKDAEISDLELVNWVEEEASLRGVALREGKRIENPYETFEQLYDAILEHGVFVIANPNADVVFFTPSGVFDGHLIAVRQSGRNVRRFLIRSDLFSDQYGTVGNCINNLLSNNAVDCELELKHLNDMGEKLGFSQGKIDRKRTYDRLEIDVLAAMQLVSLYDDLFGNDSASYQAFELGYCVARLFSSAQNMVTLEPDASKANEYRKSYEERGKKGKSKDRRSQRLDHLFQNIVELVSANKAFSRLKPIEVAKLALADAAKENPALWTQGKGQLDQYLSHYASDPKFHAIYYELFPQTA